MRQLHGQNIPIPPPLPPPITPRTPQITSDPDPESFDPGINSSLNNPPERLMSPQPAQPETVEPGARDNRPSSPHLKQKPTVPPRPSYLGSKSRNVQGVSSEMESDDYHHISEHLHRAAEKINKTKLSIMLRDKDKPPPPSHLSESDEEESVTDPNIYPYNDGEVALKK